MREIEQRNNFYNQSTDNHNTDMGATRRKLVRGKFYLSWAYVIQEFI